jgi:hypothetical protein
LLLEKFERAAAGTRSLKIFSRESSSWKLARQLRQNAISKLEKHHGTFC